MGAWLRPRADSCVMCDTCTRPMSPVFNLHTSTRQSRPSSSPRKMSTHNPNLIIPHTFPPTFLPSLPPSISTAAHETTTFASSCRLPACPTSFSPSPHSISPSHFPPPANFSQLPSVSPSVSPSKPARPRSRISHVATGG